MELQKFLSLRFIVSWKLSEWNTMLWSRDLRFVDFCLKYSKENNKWLFYKNSVISLGAYIGASSAEASMLKLRKMNRIRLQKMCGKIVELLLNKYWCNSRQSIKNCAFSTHYFYLRYTNVMVKKYTSNSNTQMHHCELEHKKKKRRKKEKSYYKTHSIVDYTK